jgi:hypothetical protein
MRARPLAVAVVLALVLAVAGCSGATGQAVPAHRRSDRLHRAAHRPPGRLRSRGPDAVELAIRQANQRAAVVGVVGTINSGVAKLTAPVLAGRSIVQISPCTTDPTLTLGPYPIDAPGG